MTAPLADRDVATAPSASECPAPAVAESPRPDVLLVEDDRCEAELVVRALGVAVSVATVADGRLALQCIRERRPRLVLLDLKMGGMNGFDVLAEIGAAPDLDRVPVIVLTSSSDPRDVERARVLGAHGYVVKPIEHSRLAARLAALVGQWLGSPATDAAPGSPR